MYKIQRKCNNINPAVVKYKQSEGSCFLLGFLGKVHQLFLSCRVYPDSSTDKESVSSSVISAFISFNRRQHNFFFTTTLLPNYSKRPVATHNPSVGLCRKSTHVWGCDEGYRRKLSASFCCLLFFGGLAS